MRSSRSLLLAAVSVLCAPLAIADVMDAWSEPLDVRLVSASRSIALAPGVDAKAWAGAAGLERFRVFGSRRDGAIVETTMFEQEWQERSAQLCAGPDVRACETSQCQSIQLAGQVQAIGNRPNEVTTARLLRRPPSIVEILARREQCGSTAETDFDGSVDVSASAASGDSTGASSGAITPGAEPSAGASTAAGTEAPEEAGTAASPGSATSSAPSGAPTLGEVTFQDGRLSIPDDALPDDPENWTLAVAVGCTLVKTPLDTIVPAVDHSRVVALVTGASGTAQAVGASLALTVLKEHALTAIQESLVTFEVPPQSSVAATVALLAADPRVSSAQPDYLYRTSAEASDPYAFMNYGPAKTGALRLHEATTGGGLLVAVIDTGVDLEQPDLTGQVAEHRDLTDEGWSADAHGTAVAGVIAAHLDNGIGSYGVAPGVKLLALKACQPVRPGAVEAQCWTSTLARALDAVIEADARIVNMSLGGPPDPLVERYIGIATGQNRVVVAAAGNGGPVARPAFPAALDDVVAVTATDAFDRAYRDATTGAFVDVAAPGVDIVVPGLEQSFPALSGTSLATAHFSALAALLMDLAPLASSAELRGALTANARDLGRAGVDDQFGAGLVDVCAATAYATGEAVVCREERTDESP